MVRLWCIASGQLLQTYDEYGEAGPIRFSPDVQQIAWGGPDPSVVVVRNPFAPALP
jgi:hypothetical protein